MDLSDQDILGVYNTAKEQGHPDPIGLLARSQVLSGLSNSFATKDRFGITGVRQEDVDRLGVGEASDVVSNLSAAIKVDLDNFANFKDVGNMHVAFHSGGDAVADRSKRPKKFMRELSKAKVALDKRIKSLQRKKPEPEEPQVDQISVPQFSPGVGNSLVDNAGDATRIQQVRVNSRNAQPAQRRIPKSQTTQARKQLRSVIREALRSA